MTRLIGGQPVLSEAGTSSANQADTRPASRVVDLRLIHLQAAERGGTPGTRQPTPFRSRPTTFRWASFRGSRPPPGCPRFAAHGGGERPRVAIVGRRGSRRDEARPDPLDTPTEPVADDGRSSPRGCYRGVATPLKTSDGPVFDRGLLPKARTPPARHQRTKRVADLPQSSAERHALSTVRKERAARGW